MHKTRVTAALIAIGTLVACAEAPGDGARIAINVAPFEIEAVTNASYQLTVRNNANEVVWTRPIDAASYGRGGSLSYVGPCDAQSSPNTVTVEILGLFNGTTPVDPAIYSTPGAITRSVECAANQDTSVEFDITILIDPPNTTQFLSFGVSFANIFCSAKLDCRDEDDDPLLLLHDATGARAQTAVVALSCTAGAGADTVLYRDDLVITCDDGAGTVLHTMVDPAAGPGNLSTSDGISGDAGVLYGAAVSVGDEQLGYSNAYWNVLLGIAPGAKGCTLTTTGTAHDGAFLNDTVPLGTVWPYIDWAVDLTDTDGKLICTRHPVQGTSPYDGVSALYTDGTAISWSHIYFRDSSATPGSTAATAGSSCDQLVTAHPALPSGTYYVDPDGAGAVAPFQVYCEMVPNDGGWALYANHADSVAIVTADVVTPAGYGVLPDAKWQALRDAMTDGMRFVDENGWISKVSAAKLQAGCIPVGSVASLASAPGGEIWHDETAGCNGTDIDYSLVVLLPAQASYGASLYQESVVKFDVWPYVWAATSYEEQDVLRYYLR